MGTAVFKGETVKTSRRREPVQPGNFFTPRHLGNLAYTLT